MVSSVSGRHSSGRVGLTARSRANRSVIHRINDQRAASRPAPGRSCSVEIAQIGLSHAAMPPLTNSGNFRITNPRGLPVRPSEYRELGAYSAEQFAPHSRLVITSRHARPAVGGARGRSPSAVLAGRAPRPLGRISAAAGAAGEQRRARYEPDERRQREWQQTRGLFSMGWVEGIYCGRNNARDEA